MANKVTVTALKVLANFLYVKAVPADNLYVTGGVALNLSPGNILDPSALGVTGPSQVPVVNPGVFSESLGGFYAQVVPTTGDLTAYKLQYFESEGTELPANTYPAAISGGTLVLAIPYES
jgi:hypothetical protein